eukprot:SAG31_NODE_24670_length_476_cov_1.368700_2_plen_42_part_01
MDPDDFVGAALLQHSVNLTIDGEPYCAVDDGCTLLPYYDRLT